MPLYNVDNYIKSTLYTIHVRSLNFFPEFKIIDLKTDFFINNAPQLFNIKKENNFL